MAEPQAQADTRGALLDAAEGLFSKRGYAAVGIREITDAAGVNIAAIKYHFGSKSELYLQTVRRAMERSETAASYEVLREGISEPLEAATMLVRFIHLFLDRHMATESPSPVCSLILHEAAEPTEAIDSVVRDFIGPHERMHYRIFKPVLERMAVGDLTDRRKIRSIADHIARFSLRGLGCSPDLVEEAVANAAEIERDAAPKQRAPK
ncbi:MAG: TetR/AcrR family transcriptional regulator [Planctomycetota bacterium]|jgi:AcrR family transcriptional regulator